MARVKKPTPRKPVAAPKPKPAEPEKPRKIRSVKLKQAAFLVAFSLTASVKKAAKSARIARDLHYQWLETDQNYPKRFEQSRARAVQVLIDEAVRRSHEGTQKPVFYQGEECGAILEYSDSLLMFLLRAFDPDRFRERSSIEHSGPGGGPVEISPQLASLAEVLTPDELTSIRARLLALARRG